MLNVNSLKSIDTVVYSALVRDDLPAQPIIMQCAPADDELICSIATSDDTLACEDQGPQDFKRIDGEQAS